MEISLAQPLQNCLAERRGSALSVTEFTQMRSRLDGQEYSAHVGAYDTNGLRTVSRTFGKLWSDFYLNLITLTTLQHPGANLPSRRRNTN